MKFTNPFARSARRFPQLPDQVPQRGTAGSRALFKNIFRRKAGKWWASSQLAEAVLLSHRIRQILMRGMVLPPYSV